MSFYSSISEIYNELFPFQVNAYNFIQSYTNRNSRILDLGCGTGSFISKLSLDVKEAYGIDMDIEMISTAKRNANHATFSVMNIMEIDSIEREFDLIYSIGNVISYLSENDIKALSNKVESKLSKNGIWLFQTVNWDKLDKKKVFNFPVKEIKDKGIKFYRSYERINNKSVFFKVRIEKDNKLMFENKEILNSLLSNEMIDIHASNNLNIKNMYGDFLKSNFNDVSKASIYVFTR